MDRTPTIDQAKLDEFMGRFVDDFGAALHGATVVVGERLGLYKAMAGAGELTSQELADKTQTNERYVCEWLAAQAASGYVNYDGKSGKYWLSPEQALALADENSRAYIPGAFQIAASAFEDAAKITEAFRTGKGVAWHEHHPELFEGSAKFSRPGYVGQLLGSWLPALDCVVPKLEAGARVADVGCGYGATTILMANAYPRSTFTGYDIHKGSIEKALKSAGHEGLADRVKFEVSSAKEYPGREYDLVAFFNCLHDMGDPAGAAKHVLRSLEPDGTWMIVEPFANERIEDNLNPVGRIFYSASTMISTPASLAEEVGLALGSQVSGSRLREIVLAAGFKTFRLVAETHFNRIFEARP